MKYCYYRFYITNNTIYTLYLYDKPIKYSSKENLE